MSFSRSDFTIQPAEADSKHLQGFSILFSFALLPFSSNFLFQASADKNTTT